ncbi:acyl-CoA thioesterase [Acinetobacter tibetensis]|uniref:Acyl-CoA thioesterase n=1 Tax=Acinetobacter tibetensis TaxID=2943497 RepID=A0AAE9LPA4_9GAMM|nr:acyl-CoA thioesterase [Acinetobacter tibetensis]USE82045.1 acyl-CoA thioesterase [Acinetobacter tibetensis]
MKKPRKKPEYPPSNWTIDQDSFLIENSSMPIEELLEHLPFNEDEILHRKEILGLSRRQKQMRKFLTI